MNTPEQRIADAIALIRALPAYPDPPAVEEWRALARSCLADYSDPVAVAEGLTIIARQLAMLAAEASAGSFTGVLDALYATLIDVANNRDATG